MLKSAKVIAVREAYQGSVLIILASFLKFLDGKYLENPLQSLQRVTEFSQEKSLE